MDPKCNHVHPYKREVRESAPSQRGQYGNRTERFEGVVLKGGRMVATALE